MPNRPAPRDMLEWEIGKAIANAVHENPPPRPVGRIAGRAVLAAIEAAGWALVEKVDG